INDEIETKSVTGKKIESNVQHKQEAQNTEHKSVDPADKIESRNGLDIKTEKNERNKDDYDDPEEEMDEEITDVQKTVNEVKSINIIGTSSPSSDVDAMKLKDQDTMHLSIEADINVNDVSVDNNEADDRNLQGSVKSVLLQVKLSGNFTAVCENCREISTDIPSALAHLKPLPDSESQNMYVNADQTENSVGNAEELEKRQIREVHENDTETEGSGSDKQADTHQGSADTDGLLYTEQNVEGKAMTVDSGEIINSVDGNLEDSSENLKTQNVTVHPEAVSDKVTYYCSETLSEVKDGIKSNLLEEPHPASTQTEMQTTTATSSQEQYFEVPLYEPSREDSSTVASTFTSEEPLLSMEDTELMSEEGSIIKPSTGLLSDITDNPSAGIGALTYMFGGSTSDSHIPQVPGEVNESNQDFTAEKIPHTNKAEDMNINMGVGRTGWPSVWVDLNTGHIVIGSGNNHLNKEEETNSSPCKVNYDPSAGTDVSGYLPSTLQKPDDLPDIPEETVTVEFPEHCSIAMDLQRLSSKTTVYRISAASRVLLFSLGHHYTEQKRRDGSLAAKINGFKKELLVSTIQCLPLKDDLQTTRGKLLSTDSSSVDSIQVVVTLNAELEKSTVVRGQLEKQVAFLEKELGVATEVGLKLKFISAQHGCDTVMKSVEHLQKQVGSQKIASTNATASLNHGIIQNNTLQPESIAPNDKISLLEADLLKTDETRNDVLSAKLMMEEQLLKKNKLLQSQLYEEEDRIKRETGQLPKEKTSLQETVAELQHNIRLKESDIAVLQVCVEQVKTVGDDKDGDKLQELLDLGLAKAELQLMTIERDTLAEKLQDEVAARKLLENNVMVISEEVTRLRGKYEEAEKEKIKAQIRFETISNYFKEKENQLQKELRLHKAMCLLKDRDATSTYERINSFQREIENYRSQNETLKKEILDQERGLKYQIATLEIQAHENWVAARQAERKLEASELEASLLRNRLNIDDKIVINSSKFGETPLMYDRMPEDSNGELPSSRVHMGISAFQDSPSFPLHYQLHDGLPNSSLPPLLPGHHLPPRPMKRMPLPPVFIPPWPLGPPFMPPPPPPPLPLPLFPGDRRQPPSGRMSPPPPHHYSPPPPPSYRGSFSLYGHSPPSSPPPGRTYGSPSLHDDNSPDRGWWHRLPPPPLCNPYSYPASRPKQKSTKLQLSQM
ncbi:hypothetical protein B7P43_G03185, partial [Cryptotermes secundus]